MDGSDNEKLHCGRHTVQIGDQPKDRLNRLSEATGLSQGQVVDWLMMQRSYRDMLRDLKAANLSPIPRGRRKQSIFAFD